MNEDSPKTGDGKLIAFPRWPASTGPNAEVASPRDPEVTKQIVTILKDMLLSWRLPKTGGTEL